MTINEIISMIDRNENTETTFTVQCTKKAALGAIMVSSYLPPTIRTNYVSAMSANWTLVWEDGVATVKAFYIYCC